MQKTKGISLIVLVITIIVMIVLAGAIILSLNNSGIINKASDAVEQTDLATVKELAQMAWGDAYAGGERTEEGLKAAVDKTLSDNKVDASKYIVEVTTKGVTVVLKRPWVQQGLTVTNGTVTLEIGDSIAYDETAGGTITGLTATDWKVLGASEEGDLLIMSTSNVDYLLLGDEEDLEKAQSDWLNGAATLDGICEAYGKGNGATGVRSITVEDINRMTGYDPKNEKYGEESLYEYGDVVTYSYNGTTKPTYSGSNGKTGTLSSAHSNGFHFYNGTEFVHVNDLTTGTRGTIFATLKNDSYYVTPDLDLIEYGSKAYTMLFGEYDSYYLLASPCVITSTDAAYFSMCGVEDGDIYYKSLWVSDGDAHRQYWNTGHSYFVNEGGVRAVVSLSSDISITGSSASGWTF